MLEMNAEVEEALLEAGEDSPKESTVGEVTGGESGEADTVE